MNIVLDGGPDTPTGMVVEMLYVVLRAKGDQYHFCPICVFVLVGQIAPHSMQPSQNYFRHSLGNVWQQRVETGVVREANFVAAGVESVLGGHMDTACLILVVSASFDDVSSGNVRNGSSDNLVL